MSKSLTDQFALSKNMSLIIRSKGFCGGEKERHHVQIELARSRNSSRNSSGRWKDFLIFRHNNSKWLGCVRGTFPLWYFWDGHNASRAWCQEGHFALLWFVGRDTGRDTLHTMFLVHGVRRDTQCGARGVHCPAQGTSSARKCWTQDISPDKKLMRGETGWVF